MSVLSAHEELAQELAQATREAGTPPPAAAPPAPDYEDPADFEPDTAADIDELSAALDTDDTEPEAGPSKSTLRKSAARLVSAFSVMLKLLAKKIYPARMLEPGDTARYQEVKATVEAQPKARQEEAFNTALADPETSAMYARFLACENVIQAAPLDEDEQAMIAEPLAECLEKWKVAPGPEAALVLAIILVMLPRIEPLFPGLAKVLGNAR